ncbi:hypothetical protein ACIP9H_33890 [Streptomyces sp. NPDC088732]|uniref:hypothetical protein n=1 Tax=Streptomyces sp. NPDC088732 TaxID=3365879 RepID=UPI0037F57DBE
MQSRTSTVLGTVAAGLLLAGCAHYPVGPSGKVVDKDKDYVTVGKVTKTEYYLTVRKADGTEQQFRVASNHYDRCFRNSTYPACTARKDRG